MVATVSSRAATFPEDWNKGIEAGTTYMFDPMHFPFPITPLTSSTTLGPSFSVGTLAAFQELNVPIESVEVVHRNHYRFERWAPLVPVRARRRPARLVRLHEASIKVGNGTHD